jgi:hypothetical protein
MIKKTSLKMPKLNLHYTTITYFSPDLDNVTQMWLLFVLQI